MLDDKGIQYRYRDYTNEPLYRDGLREILKMLNTEPEAILRKTGKIARGMKLTGSEPAGDLIRLMSEHPTLIQRPTGIKGKKTVLGLPVEKLLEL